MANEKNIFDFKDPASKEIFACNFPSATQENEIVDARVRVVEPSTVPGQGPVPVLNSPLVISSPEIVGGQVRVMIEGGKLGEKYKVEFEADFTNGEVQNFSRDITIKDR